MNKILRLVSFAALAFILLSALLCAGEKISSQTNRHLILVGTIVWFAVTPIWLRKNNTETT